MIQSVESFVRYFESIRRRTLKFARALPPERVDWSPAGDDFTCGDILRHMAAIEQISCHAVVSGRWQPYPGHGRELAPTLGNLFARLEDTHTEAMRTLLTLSDGELNQPRTGLDGQPIKAWRLLMAMVEHEVHHRSQLASYMSMMGVEAPQLYGLGVEDVVIQSAKLAADPSRE